MILLAPLLLGAAAVGVLALTRREVIRSDLTWVEDPTNPNAHMFDETPARPKDRERPLYQFAGVPAGQGNLPRGRMTRLASRR